MEKTLEVLTKLKEQTQQVLNTLPVAYYLKVSNIEVILDEIASTSYFDFRKFNIHIALNNIYQALNGKDYTDFNEVEFEQIVRGFQYHELSHTILTPRNLMDWANEFAKSGKLLNPNLANIIEDERIETLLKHYYHNVDFKGNLKRVVKLQHAKTFEHFVFNAVRFRYCPTDKKLVNKAVIRLIESTKNIDAYRNDNGYKLAECMEWLLSVLKDVWDKLPKATEPETSKEKSGKTDKTDHTETADTEGEDDTENSESSDEDLGSENAENDNEDDTTDDTEGDEDSEESNDADGEDDTDDASKTTDGNGETTEGDQDIDEDSESEMSGEYEDDFIPTETDTEIDAELIDKLVAEAMLGAKEKSAYSGGYKMSIADFICDKDTKCEMLKIIGRNIGFGNNQNAVQYGYSGKFNTKRFATDFNDSCKWFAKKSYDDTGINARKSEKRILNIWLDQSGSFEYNDESVNKVLKALYEIEKDRTDFEWRLIKLTCDCNLVEDKSARFSKSWSGNALPQKKIAETYNKVNNSMRELNIVLFDGPANSMDFYDEYRHDGETYGFKSLAPFNNNRTIFITNPSNTESIKSVCPNARETITSTAYVSELSRNIVKAMDLLF